MGFAARWFTATVGLGFIGAWMSRGFWFALETGGWVGLVAIFGLVVAASSYAALPERE